ncbi:hypothetical protein K501DRAFT_101995 [Backusella circina FSU 941]|nr:hypothetical protein K501DRAFT_101995 [Backusella circina FSU 941]
MESIHTNLPLLKSLILVDMMFMQCPTINNIEPAVLLTKLHIATQLKAAHNTRSAWLRYIGKKYPNLSNLNIPFLDDKILEGKDDEGNVINQNDIYQAMFNGFGPQLKKLELSNSSVPYNLFEILDKSGCALKELRLNTFINNSAVGRMPFTVQSYNIQKLVIQFKSARKTKWLQIMPSLKHLVLICGGLTIEFETIMKLCTSRLESLEISNMDISTMMPSAVKNRTLRSLKLTKCKIPDDFDTFISNTLPELSTLKLIFCPFQKEIFSIPNLRLFHLEYLDHKFRQRNKVLVNTWEDKESKLYISGHRYRDNVKDRYDNSTPSLYPASKCTAPGATPYLTVECASVKNVTV